VTEKSLPDYAIDAHTVKGSSASIGAKMLRASALKMELLAKSGDLSGVLNENEAFIKEAETLVADILNWLERDR